MREIFAAADRTRALSRGESIAFHPPPPRRFVAETPRKVGRKETMRGTYGLWESSNLRVKCNFRTISPQRGVIIGKSRPRHGRISARVISRALFSLRSSSGDLFYANRPVRLVARDRCGQPRALTAKCTLIARIRHVLYGSSFLAGHLIIARRFRDYA